MARAYAGENAEIRALNRRRKLIEAGKQCFGEKGFSKAKIKEICSAADLTERYFYESFKNKEELLGVVYVMLVDGMLEDMQEIAEKYQDTPLEAMKQLSYGYFLLFKNDPNRAQTQLFEILGVSDNLNQIYQKKLREAAEIMRDIIKMLFPKLSEAHLKPLYFTAFTGALWQLANEWVLSGYEQDITELAASFEELLFFFTHAKL